MSQNHNMNPAFFQNQQQQQQQQMANHFAQMQQANLAMANPNMNPAMNAFRIGMNGQPLPVQADDDESDIIPEDPNALSRISITIRSPILISGNNNLIACDAAATANAIALGVVQSLRQLSMGQHGIPMIDEQGRPRPLGVEIIAEMRVEGSQNVVGERAVLARMLDLKEKTKEKFKEARVAAQANLYAQAQGNGGASGHTNASGQAKGNANGYVDGDSVKIKQEKKREREVSEEVEADAEPKRTRRDE